MGWRKPEEGKDWLEVQFEFEQVRKFSSLDLFSNNFPSKGVQVSQRDSRDIACLHLPCVRTFYGHTCVHMLVNTFLYGVL